MEWHAMSPHHQGKNPEGHDIFVVPLPLDDDGMAGRECSQEQCQPRYFKIAPREAVVADNTGGDSLHCPYCGHQAGMQGFTTKDQLAWMKSMLLRDVHRMFQETLSRSFPARTSSRSGFHFTYQPGRLSSVRHYAEQKLKRVVTCDQCSSNYAVYGISFFCPRCGRGNLHVHLQRSIEIIKTLLGMKLAIEGQAGTEAGYHLLGNCLEDCVSLFEGFLKAIYAQALRFLTTDDIRHQKLSALRNAFQNLSRAEKIMRADLGFELFGDMSQSQREFIALHFAKRHVITHNLALVDEQFRSQAQVWQETGQDIEIDPHDITKLLSLLDGMLQKGISMLEAIRSNADASHAHQEQYSC